MSRYTILSAISLWLLAALPVAAQQQKRMSAEEDQRSWIARKLDLTDTIPVFQGMNVSVDAVGPVGNVLGSDFFYLEAALEVNLMNRFFPILEIGYGSTDATHDDTELHYKTAAPYFRLGFNYNIQYKKKRPGYIYAGARVAYTSFEYDVDGPPLTDPIWGGEAPFRLTGVKSNVLWGELMMGVRAQVFKDFSMGWSLRYKIRLKVKDGESSSPWYVPGFGANDNTKFGLTYDLVYRIPWKNKKDKETAQ